MLARFFPAFATLLIGAALGLAMRASGSPALPWLYAGVAYVICAALALVYLRSEEALTEQLQYKGGDATRGLLAAAGALVVVYGASVAALALLPTFATRELTTVVRTVVAVPEKWQRLCAIVVLAAAEEIVWRGAVLHALEARIGSARAPWVAGALYVASLVPTLRLPMIGAAAVLAVATTLVVRRTGRVTPAIIGHAMFTWLAIELILPALWNGVR
jgi:membrane protease YdiL (CAAX protease family)